MSYFWLSQPLLAFISSFIKSLLQLMHQINADIYSSWMLGSECASVHFNFFVFCYYFNHCITRNCNSSLSLSTTKVHRIWPSWSAQKARDLSPISMGSSICESLLQFLCCIHVLCSYPFQKTTSIQPCKSIKIIITALV